jgi:hypothetical protein
MSQQLFHGTITRGVVEVVAEVPHPPINFIVIEKSKPKEPTESDVSETTEDEVS